MNTVGRSPVNIRQIRTIPTRRTSRQHFHQSMLAILNAADNLMNPNVRARLIRNVRKAQFAFNTLRQRIEQRKFPQNLVELYAYLFLPIELVSDQLGVSIELLNSRCEEQGLRWPRGSTPRSLLVAVQITNLHQIVDLRRIRVGRNVNFGVVRQTVVPVAAQAHTELHVEIQGRRYGPLLTDEQWLEVVNHPYNLHRINLIAVNHGP